VWGLNKRMETCPYSNWLRIAELEDGCEAQRMEHPTTAVKAHVLEASRGAEIRPLDATEMQELLEQRWMLEQIQFLLGHVSVQTTERYIGCKQRLRVAVNDRLGIEPG
jgi:site-specific recombinase XerD